MNFKFLLTVNATVYLCSASHNMRYRSFQDKVIEGVTYKESGINEPI